MKTILELREYRSPEVTKIQMDNEISLTMASTPPSEPWGSKLIAPQKEDPFKTNLA